MESTAQDKDATEHAPESHINPVRKILSSFSLRQMKIAAENAALLEEKKRKDEEQRKRDQAAWEAELAMELEFQRSNSSDSAEIETSKTPLSTPTIEKQIKLKPSRRDPRRILAAKARAKQSKTEFQTENGAQNNSTCDADHAQAHSGGKNGTSIPRKHHDRSHTSEIYLAGLTKQREKIELKKTHKYLRKRAAEERCRAEASGGGNRDPRSAKTAHTGNVAGLSNPQQMSFPKHESRPRRRRISLLYESGLRQQRKKLHIENSFDYLHRRTERSPNIKSNLREDKTREGKTSRSPSSSTCAPHLQSVSPHVSTSNGKAPLKFHLPVEMDSAHFNRPARLPRNRSSTPPPESSISVLNDFPNEKLPIVAARTSRGRTMRRGIYKKKSASPPPRIAPKNDPSGSRKKVEFEIATHLTQFRSIMNSSHARALHREKLRTRFESTLIQYRSRQQKPQSRSMYGNGNLNPIFLDIENGSFQSYTSCNKVPEAFAAALSSLKMRGDAPSPFQKIISMVTAGEKRIQACHQTRSSVCALKDSKVRAQLKGLEDRGASVIALMGNIVKQLRSLNRQVT